MKIVIIGKDDVKQFDDALKTPYSFLRFHSPHCGHCVSMEGAMKGLMEDKNLKKIDGLTIVMLIQILQASLIIQFVKNTMAGYQLCILLQKGKTLWNMKVVEQVIIWQNIYWKK